VLSLPQEPHSFGHAVSYSNSFSRPGYGRRWLCKGCPASGWAVAGIGMAALLAAGYIFQIGLHQWFNYHDVSHVVLAGSLWCFYRGSKTGIPDAGNGFFR
jgi:hypothetical protein